jgi:polyphenol oxidase
MQIEFKNYPQIIAGLSERNDGSMIWWNRLPVDEAVRQNRDDYFLRNKIDPQKVIAGGIAYGTNVTLVGKAEAGKYLLNTDALVTNAPDIFLSVTAADCLPVYFYDPIKKAIGMAHASWHGLVGGILENVVKKFQESFESRPENIQVIIGPHIGKCHYEVGPEVAVKFAQQHIEERGGRLFADLGAEAVERLRNCGAGDIINSPECTYDDPQKFFSARRDKSEPLQGMLAYLGIRE